jgi:hypothetical protein
MPTLDGESRRLELCVAVVGGRSDAFLSALPLSDNVFNVGEVHGLATTLVLESFPIVDPWAGEGSEGSRLAALKPRLDALVLTDSLDAGSHYSSAALERLCALLSPGKVGIPAAIFGGPALAMEWQSLTGVEPVFADAPSDDNALRAIRTLAKTTLRSLRRSEVPPPK